MAYDFAAHEFESMMMGYTHYQRSHGYNIAPSSMNTINRGIPDDPNSGAMPLGIEEMDYKHSTANRRIVFRSSTDFMHLRIDVNGQTKINQNFSDFWEVRKAVARLA